jgi:hypothetical protein
MTAVRHVAAGLLSGLGAVVLLQQFAVLYPTGTVTLLGIAIGIAVQFAIAAIVDRMRPPVAATYTASPVPTYTASPVPAHSESPPIADEAVAAWAPTHRVPVEGLDAWQEPDPAAAPIARLDAGLEVRVERTDGAWAQIVCENGWSAWVDDRRLEARA